PEVFEVRSVFHHHSQACGMVKTVLGEPYTVADGINAMARADADARRAAELRPADAGTLGLALLMAFSQQTAKNAQAVGPSEAQALKEEGEKTSLRMSGYVQKLEQLSADPNH